MCLGVGAKNPAAKVSLVLSIMTLLICFLMYDPVAAVGCGTHNREQCCAAGDSSAVTGRSGLEGSEWSERHEHRLYMTWLLRYSSKARTAHN